MVCAQTILVTVDYRGSNTRVHPFSAALELRTALRQVGHRAYMVPVEAPIETLAAEETNVMVFPVAEGLGHGSGLVRRRLLAASIPVIGSDAEAFALATDKNRACERLAAAGIAIPRGATVCSTDLDWIPDLPAVVKPAIGGGSEGVVLARTRDELCRSVYAGLAVGHEALRVEMYVEGREFTVWVIEEMGRPAITGLVEIVRNHDGIFDRAAKTGALHGDLRFLTQPALTPPDRAKLLEVAIAAHEAVGASIYSRADLILGADGPVVIEVNVAPRLGRGTVIGLDQATGIEFSVAIGKLVAEAAERHWRSASHWHNR